MSKRIIRKNGVATKNGEVVDMTNYKPCAKYATNNSVERGFSEHAYANKTVLTNPCFHDPREINESQFDKETFEAVCQKNATRTGTPLNDGYYIGVDPGLNGCISLIHVNQGRIVSVDTYDNEQYRAFDLNAVDNQTKKQGAWRNKLCMSKLNKKVAEFAQFCTKAVVEDVCGFDNQRASASFNFGDAVGATKMSLAVNNIEMCLVQPVKWKVELGIKGKKHAYYADKSSDFVFEDMLNSATKYAPGLHIDMFTKQLNYHNELVFNQNSLEATLIAVYNSIMSDNLDYNLA